MNTSIRTAVLMTVACGFGRSASPPAGFAVDRLAGLSSATAMAFAPDGRLFICQQGGSLRIFKNGAVLGAPFVTLSVDSMGERGLLGIAFDPNFASNQFVYVYYTALTSPRRNRVSRFTASGDVAAPGSELVIFELDDLSAATNHNGGAIHFGPGGKLYIAAGENANGANSQSLATVLGKILRIDPDGTIPSDNPFFFTATGKNRAIWALGLRNPFTFDFQPGTGRMFINDVGEVSWEEINDGVAGANYGWPATEGMFNAGQFPQYTNPLLAYPHKIIAGGCAITGGAFYNPADVQFPATYLGSYFYADLCSGWIRRFQPSDGTSSGFLTGALLPVDLKVGSEGLLYYLERNAVYRIRYTGNDTRNRQTVAGAFLFGESESIPVAGDRDHSRTTGGLSGGTWLPDNGNFRYDGPVIDKRFAGSQSQPVAGDWEGAGSDKIGGFQNGPFAARCQRRPGGRVGWGGADSLCRRLGWRRPDLYRSVPGREPGARSELQLLRRTGPATRSGPLVNRATSNAL